MFSNQVKWVLIIIVLQTPFSDIICFLLHINLPLPNDRKVRRMARMSRKFIICSHITYGLLTIVESTHWPPSPTPAKIQSLPWVLLFFYKEVTTQGGLEMCSIIQTQTVGILQRWVHEHTEGHNDWFSPSRYLLSRLED